MKKKILNLQIIAVITITIFTGCLLNTKDDWNKLPDRKFYFSEFHFVLLSQNKEASFEFFRKFPLKKLMFILAREYNITIDITEFNDFINTKNLSLIETKGLLRSAENLWKTGKIDNNRITLIFNQDYFEGSIQKLKIGIYSGNSTLKIIEIEMNKVDSIFKELKYKLPSSEQSLLEYEEKNYDKISPIPLIIEENRSSSIGDEQDSLVKIKTMIDNYVKPLDKREKDIFKHDIIDYIYQKCE